MTRLTNLDAKDPYELTDPYTGEGLAAAGAKLASDGLEFALPPMSSRVLMYRRSP